MKSIMANAHVGGCKFIIIPYIYYIFNKGYMPGPTKCPSLQLPGPRSSLLLCPSTITCINTYHIVTAKQS